MTRKLPYITTLILFLLPLTSCNKKTSLANSTTYFESMDTFMSIKAQGKEAKKAVAEARKQVKTLEALLSVTNKKSAIYKLNREAEKHSLTKYTLPPSVIDIIFYSLSMAKKTQGVFNPCLYPITSLWGFTKGSYKIPLERDIKDALLLTDYKRVSIDKNTITMPQGYKIDLGAVGKGAAGDAIVNIFKSYDIENALIDLGGNIVTLGDNNKEAWKIGVKSPFNSSVIGYITSFSSPQHFITSGGYERYFVGEDGKKYSHIFSSKTGHPIETNLLSATVIGERGLMCDALSTTLYCLGSKEAIDFYKKSSEYSFILITDNKELYINSFLLPHLTLLDKEYKIKEIK